MSIKYLLISFFLVHSINGQTEYEQQEYQSSYFATPQPEPRRSKSPRHSLWDLLEKKYPEELKQDKDQTVNQIGDKPTNPNKDNSDDDDEVKIRLLNLLHNGKKKLDRRMASADKIHELYKNDPVYRIGYLISFINKAYDTLSDLYTYVDKDKDKWDAIKVLNAYEQMQKSTKFLNHLIGVLNSFASEDEFERQPRKYSSMPIAWSYYD